MRETDYGLKQVYKASLQVYSAGRVRQVYVLCVLVT